jgi:putative ABC transport system permease protein
MWYAINTIIRETNRFGPAIVAVSACSMLLMVQISLFLSAMSYVAKPIASAHADLWVAHGDVLSYNEGRPIPQRWVTRVASQPGVMRTEYYLMGTAFLQKPAGGTEMCTVVGVPLGTDSLGAGQILSPELRAKLQPPGAVAADTSELARLGFQRYGYVGEVSGRSIYYVGATYDFKRWTGPYLFCSLETARQLLPTVQAAQTTFILVQCGTPQESVATARALRRDFGEMKVYTQQEFIKLTQYNWFTRTKAGLMLMFVTVISAGVSLFVTSQTLYAATAAARHEYAVLDAMGIPRRYVVSSLLDMAGVPSRFELWLIVVGGAMTTTTAPISGLISLRSLQLIEPAELLH